MKTKKKEKNIFKSFKDEYEQLREDYSKKQSEKNFISLEKARENRLKIDWAKSQIKKPNKLGVTVLNNYSLSKLRDYIDWTPFFMTWELKGKYPAIFEDKTVGTKQKNFLMMQISFWIKSLMKIYFLQTECLVYSLQILWVVMTLKFILTNREPELKEFFTQ